MKVPLQIYLDETEATRLSRWAQARGWTKSEAVRAAVRAMTRPQSGDPLLTASGYIQGLPADASQHFDRHLQETFVARAPSDAKRTARRRH